MEIPKVQFWPFVESPSAFAKRLRLAAQITPTMLAAVRNVLIENPPQLSAEYLSRVITHTE